MWMFNVTKTYWEKDWLMFDPCLCWSCETNSVVGKHFDHLFFELHWPSIHPCPFKMRRISVWIVHTNRNRNKNRNISQLQLLLWCLLILWCYDTILCRSFGDGTNPSKYVNIFRDIEKPNKTENLNQWNWVSRNGLGGAEISLISTLHPSILINVTFYFPSPCFPFSLFVCLVGGHFER